MIGFWYALHYSIITIRCILDLLPSLLFWSCFVAIGYFDISAAIGRFGVLSVYFLQCYILHGCCAHFVLIFCNFLWYEFLIVSFGGTRFYLNSICYGLLQIGHTADDIFGHVNLFSCIFCQSKKLYIFIYLCMYYFYCLFHICCGYLSDLCRWFASATWLQFLFWCRFLCFGMLLIYPILYDRFFFGLRVSIIDVVCASVFFSLHPLLYFCFSFGVVVWLRSFKEWFNVRYAYFFIVWWREMREGGLTLPPSWPNPLFLPSVPVATDYHLCPLKRTPALLWRTFVALEWVDWEFKYTNSRDSRQRILLVSNFVLPYKHADTHIHTG